MSLEKISIHCPCISGFIPPRVIASVLFQSSDHRGAFWSPGFTGDLWEVLRPRRCPRFPPQFLFHFLLGCSVSPCHVKDGSNVELGDLPGCAGGSAAQEIHLSVPFLGLPALIPAQLTGMSTLPESYCSFTHCL